ncbi:MAG TPA: hypothetical protein VFE57_09355 [Cyclobacteriaceae bacterium]|nr:hypothetical protein [Cyclobacteriaceae bacterium]
MNQFITQRNPVVGHFTQVEIGAPLYLNVRGKDLLLFKNAESGKIIYRDKINTITGIKHPGIILGEDAYNKVWVIHNHYKIGHAEIVTLEEFSMGTKWFFDDRPVSYSKDEIVTRAIESWKKKEKYNWLTNNCQKFVNRVARNKNYSEAMSKVSSAAMITGALITVGGLIAGNKTALKAGLSILGIGAAGSFLNK